MNMELRFHTSEPTEKEEQTLKKRMEALLLVLVLLWTLSIGAVTAAAAPSAQWQIEAVGNDGIVTVELRLCGGQGITNGRVVLGYDAAKLTLTEVRAADGMGLTSLNTDTAGQIALAWVGSDITDALMLTAVFSGDGTGVTITAQTAEAWTGSSRTEVASAAETVRTNPFVDISGHWAEEEILKAYHAGLFKGMSETVFGPDQQMNRAMFVTVLYRMAGEPEANVAGMAFTDVPADSFYTEAVAWAVEQGVTNGVSQTQFAPNKLLSRQELVTMFYRYVKSTGADVSGCADLTSYPDCGRIATWAQEAFGWAVDAGVIRGMDDGSLSPESIAVRAQVAAILSRWLGL